jgi:hypothetical protein
MSNCYGPQFTLNGISNVNQSQLQIYKTAWDNYNRIQAFNSNISTIRGNGAGSKSNYYAFVSYAEKNSFRNGQYLHQQQYPNSNWNDVQQN